MTAYIGTFSNGETFNIMALGMVDAALIAAECAMDHSENVTVVKIEEDQF